MRILQKKGDGILFNKKNEIAGILTFIGGIEILAGFILGLILGVEDVGSTYSSNYEVTWSIVLMWGSIGFVSGMFIIGIAEIIEQLHTLNHKDTEVKNTVEENGISENSNSPLTSQNEIASDQVEFDNKIIDEEDLGEINYYYSSRNKKIKEIYLTPFDNKYVVLVENELNIHETDIDVVIVETESIKCSPIGEHVEIRKWYSENTEK